MTKRIHVHDPGIVPLLTAMLAGTPKLTGARCTDRPDLFDPQASGEKATAARARHHQAAALCDSCPSVALCRAWAATQPRELHRAVVGGIRPRLSGEHTTPTPQPIGA
ncbi:MAG: transcriptional regulator [Gordonia sp.]|uniref:WhiB family transcriptional regulator n=1 Tax=Gordonia sp. (in: high G+C Gram-positive bacteria) TaxID=84139 RepID=UPI000C69D7E5|nr:WhiB family transcriptional regulator [Gordonia sp. (in: high G+C Gram-positive bacteria)]MAU81880.1 transcriptional regulator [Gordonia sp. (in: high G+C Gram-positive bacteria)]